MTNPVGTKEQREELRRQPRSSSGWWQRQALGMANGLDIAEEMRQRLPPVRGCKCEDCEAGRKWDKWQKEK